MQTEFCVALTVRRLRCGRRARWHCEQNHPLCGIHAMQRSETGERGARAEGVIACAGHGESLRELA